MTNKREQARQSLEAYKLKHGRKAAGAIVRRFGLVATADDASLSAMIAATAESKSADAKPDRFAFLRRLIR
jgi:hypothetical protein